MAESPLGKRKASEVELPRAVTIDLLDGQQPVDYAFQRQDQCKAVREWLRGILAELPPPGRLQIHDVGHGMSVRHAVNEDSPMSSLAIFERDNGSVRIEVCVKPPEGAPPLAFAPTECERLVQRINEELTQLVASGSVDADRRDRARNSALVSYPGDIDAQLAHFRHEFYGEEAGERTAVLRRRLPAPAPAPANPTPAATNSSPLAPVPLGEALRNHLAELSETGQA